MTEYPIRMLQIRAYTLTNQPHLLIYKMTNGRMCRLCWLEFNVPCQHKYGYVRDDVGCVQTPTLFFSHFTLTAEAPHHSRWTHT